MSEKTTPPAAAHECAPQDNNTKAPAMSSNRALLTLVAFLALPLGLVYIMSHCNHFTPPTASLTQAGYRHPHATMQAKQAKHAKHSMLENIAKLMAEASTSPSIPHMQMRFCAGENLKDCSAYAYNKGCTKIEEQRILSVAEPGMFEGPYSACTVYR
jgi:hypothetical protein